MIKVKDEAGAEHAYFGLPDDPEKRFRAPETKKPEASPIPRKSPVLERLLKRSPSLSKVETKIVAERETKCQGEVKRGRPSMYADRPWKEAGISRATWFRRQKERKP